MEDKLTLEIFKELKKTIKRYFIAFMILLFLFFATNIAWMIAWNLPAEDTTTTTTESYDIDSKDNGNAIYNDSGKVNVNGKDKSTEDN